LKEEVLAVQQYNSSGRIRMGRRETIRENDALIRLLALHILEPGPLLLHY
jgi:hypothetical protein